MMHMISCCKSTTQVLPYGRFLTRVFTDVGVDLSGETDFEALSTYDTYDEQSLGRMKFEKAPDGSQIRRVERLPTQARRQGQVHPGVEEKAEIREMEGGVDPQRGFQQRELELDIPPFQSKGVQFKATFPEPMMFESTYTARPSSQLSFTEPPHIETPPHQASHVLDHVPWMNLSAQISFLGTHMEDLIVVSDTRFYPMKDHMDQYQTGFTSQFEYLQQRFERMEDHMDQQQTMFEHLQQRIERIESRQESQHEEMMAYLCSVFLPPLSPSQP